MHTTLNAIRAEHPCRDRWETLLKNLNKTQADDEPLSLTTIIDSNGIVDAIWCLRAVEGYDKEKRLLAVFAARQVQHLMPKVSIKALDVSERYVNGQATEEALKEAAAAAHAAANARYDAYDAAAAAASDAASYAAAYDAAYAAYDAADAAYDAACALNYDAEKQEYWQAVETKFRELFWEKINDIN